MLPRRFRNIIIDATPGEDDELSRLGGCAVRSSAHKHWTRARSIAAAFSSMAIAFSRGVFVARRGDLLVHSCLAVTLVQHRSFTACIFFLTSFFINSIQSISCNK